MIILKWATKPKNDIQGRDNFLAANPGYDGNKQDAKGFNWEWHHLNHNHSLRSGYGPPKIKYLITLGTVIFGVRENQNLKSIYA